MINVNIENIGEVETGTTNNPPAGAYALKIVDTDLRADKEGVILECDIDGGEFEGFYSDLNSKFGWWALKTFRSYKGGALKYFAQFVHNLEKSNPGYKWDQDETKWRGLRIGAVIYYKEYIGNDGRVKTRAEIDEFYSLEDIQTGNYKLRDMEKLPSAPASNGVVNMSANFQPVNDSDNLPF